MIRLLLYLFLFASGLLTKVTIKAQNETMSIEYLDSRDGLSNSSVNCVFQDSDSLVWLATWDGLNVYNGSGFKVYSYNNSNTAQSIGNNLIQQITEDDEKNIWVSTIAGISKLNKRTGNFRNYYYASDRRNHITEDQYMFVPDPHNSMYLFARATGFMKYDNQTDSFYQHWIPVKTSEIQKIIFDQKGRLWILQRSGELMVCNQVGEGFQKLHSYQLPDAINSVHVVNGNIMFTTYSKKLYTIKPGSLQYNPVARLSQDCKTITYYNNHYLFAGTVKGIEVLNNDFKPSAFLKKEFGQLENIQIISMTRGSENILWCGTDGNGVAKIYPNHQFFGIANPLAVSRSYNKQIRSFCKVDDKLWVATKGSGIISIPMDNISGQFQFHEGKKINGIENDAVFTLLKGFENLIYIGTDAKGINIYDTHNSRVVKWSEIQGNEKISFESVYSIYQDVDSSLWLGTSGYGLIHLKLKRNKWNKWSIHHIKSYKFDGKESGPANDIIYSIVKGNHGGLWIGCRYGGLSYFDVNTEQFRHYRAFVYKGSLSHNDVLSLHLTEEGALWVGTSYGLNCIQESEILSSRQPVFKHFTTSEGLSNNTIHAIISDKKGNIWVSTNRGIARIIPKTAEITNFTVTDGLQSNEFSDGSVWKNADGYIFMGGIHGFNYFLPENIQSDSVQPNLLITDLKIGTSGKSENGQIVIESKNNDDPKNQMFFKTDRSNNFFQLNMKPLSFINPEKILFSYKLDGYDKVWHFPSGNRNIEYSNLLPGTYTLKIKWSQSDGSIKEEITIFTLKVNQYAALTLPAYIFYVLILSLSGYYFYRYRKSKMEISHQLSLEHKMRQKEQELHQEKLDFFTNIAHELQTPLTLISGSLERYQHKKTTAGSSVTEQNYFLSLVNQQASKLTYLVQQLLEFRKAESGHLQKVSGLLNVSQFLTNIIELFNPLAESKDIKLQTEITDNITQYTDKDKLEKILYNLLSNAIRHSLHGSIVYVKLAKSEENAVQLTIANSGHIPENQLDKIFEKFYVPLKENINQYSSGIGLAFTRELVHLLHGSISVICENEMVIFDVVLPSQLEEKEKTANNYGQRPELPSYLLRSVTSAEINKRQLSTIENNKRALIRDLEKGHKKSILLVEDDSSIRFLLKDILEDTYNIYEAENGSEAVNTMRKILPDLIISDIMMPDMDGLQLCNLVKDKAETCHIPFILLTAKTDINQKTLGYETGADAYIAKPFHTPHLLVRIKRLLDYRDRLQEVLKNNPFDYSHSESELESEDIDFMESLINIVTDNLDNEEMNSEFIESSMKMSKKQFYRKLKTISGMTPTEFIRHIRLKKAAHYLKTTQLTVSEIFYKTGFNNQSYFFREFKKEYQLSPKEYRETQKI